MLHNGRFPLLSLPGELRNHIWWHAAANGAWPGLTRTCKQIHHELSSYCVIAPEIDSIDQLVFTVDASNVRRPRLRVSAAWSTDRVSGMLSCTVPTLDGPLLSRLHNILDIYCIELNLVPPRDPAHYFDAMMALFAGARNICGWVGYRAWLEQDKFEIDPDDNTAPLCVIVFGDNPEDTAGGAPNDFWNSQFAEERECRRLRRSAFPLDQLAQDMADLVVEAGEVEQWELRSRPLFFEYFVDLLRGWYC